MTEDEPPVPEIQFSFKRFFCIPQVKVDPTADGPGRDTAELFDPCYLTGRSLALQNYACPLSQSVQSLRWRRNAASLPQLWSFAGILTGDHILCQLVYASIFHRQIIHTLQPHSKYLFALAFQIHFWMAYLKFYQPQNWSAKKLNIKYSWIYSYRFHGKNNH